ncbi:Aryl-alcohol dehydrogenase [Colletotrichum gloeosporioides]|uniref:Aryl-alcohol dehydrogenase n=1 Tax=Colletotrichum gloeosporioides TaxID=474922 RepID=A0A8H4CRL8_COLGL|nr:Aryl-alcohol dehydrogenase [Colletotrichum gloeosporioides]KAF3808855.1 Aryl-alcohol dehydrogenase [Colletotrichum gloeosporioides]
MATIPATQVGVPRGGLKADANAEHVEHVEHIERAANQTTNASNASDLKNIETVGYVVEEVNADFKLVPVILDEIRPNEVLVEMKYSGVCHTDVVTQKGGLPMIEFPAIFGHEGAGIVRGIGKDVKIKDLALGDNVLLSFTSCNACDTCASGHTALCPESSKLNIGSVRSDKSTPGRLADGRSVRSQFFGHSSFCKMSVVNGQSVVRCPESAAASMEVYAPLGCGLQTGAGTVLNMIKPKKTDSIVVFGLGSVGLAALMAAKYLEVGQIIAIDIVPGRLELAKELGATHTFNSKESSDIVRDIQKATDGGPMYAIDCTGVLKVIEDMIACVRPLGTAVLVGVPPPAADIKIDAQAFLLANKRLIGVIEGDSYPPDFIPKLISMHQEGKFPIDRLCKTYPASELNQAIHDMHTGQVIKPVIHWT